MQQISIENDHEILITDKQFQIGRLAISAIWSYTYKIAMAKSLKHEIVNFLHMIHMIFFVQPTE